MIITACRKLSSRSISSSKEQLESACGLELLDSKGRVLDQKKVGFTVEQTVERSSMVGVQSEGKAQGQRME